MLSLSVCIIENHVPVSERLAIKLHRSTRTLLSQPKGTESHCLLKYHRDPVVKRPQCCKQVASSKVTDTNDGGRVLDASAHVLSRALVSQSENWCVKYSVTSSAKQTPSVGL
jgi:hypothetical protein